MSSFSSETIFTVGLFKSIVDCHSQDAVLHNIFARTDMKRRRTTEGQFSETILTLYRLYFNQGWEPARTYFYMMTGILLNEEDPSTVIYLNRCGYEGSSVQLTMDPRTISGDCDRRCELLNALWFDSKKYYGSNDNSDSESEEEEEDDEDSDDYETQVDEGEYDSNESSVSDIVDPRNTITPQWVQCGADS